jgi:hypothetical protein
MELIKNCVMEVLGQGFELENEKKRFILSLYDSMEKFEDLEVRRFIINAAQEFAQANLPYLKIKLDTPISNFIAIPGFGTIHHGSLDCFSTGYILLRMLKISFPDYFSSLYLSDRSQFMEPSTFEYAVSQNLFQQYHSLEEFELATSNRDCFFVLTQKYVGGKHLMIVVKDGDKNMSLIHHKNSREGFVIEDLEKLRTYLDFDTKKIYTM